ncbi:MAG: glycosyltransferase [Verrucomicrobiota bacterium]
MKILQIFNRYVYIGGEEMAVAQISAELAANHDLRSIKFDSQEWADETGALSRVRQFLLMAWNPESIRLVREQIQEFRPDLVLLHNIMPIGSAGLYVYLKNCGVPVVQFIHNFRPFSVNGYCWGNGHLLSQGLRKNFFPEIFAGAWRNSRIRTAWYGILLWSLHGLGVYRRIDGWIAISEFMKNTFIQCGIQEDRIRVISHSWQLQCTNDDLNQIAKDEKPMLLFLGRLTEEKGLRVLLDAWELLEQSSPDGCLVIAGDGPLAGEVKQRCAGMRRASYVGFKEGEDKRRLLRKCQALVVPSVWWEPLGLVLYEAYDYGKPVLAARSGGIVDNVDDGVTGWLHDPGDHEMLASQMREALADSETCRTRGANGRSLLLERTASVWINDFNDFTGRIVSDAKGKVQGTKCAEAASIQNPKFKIQNQSSPICIQAYLADQNPGYDRSFGISRMSQVVLEALQAGGEVKTEVIASKTSQQAPASVGAARILPWGTRGKWMRLLTDNLHPLFRRHNPAIDLHYFPKGYLPLLDSYCRPSVVTIHDTIIQYDEDHYPQWRNRWEYAYWAMVLKHTLRNAGRILTVSEFSKKQIQAFMDRHKIQRNEITVTYEPCMYERIPQPVTALKDNYVIHLASCEPHKRTAHLVRWWHEAESKGRHLPTLHLIGTVPPEVLPLLASSCNIVKQPFLEDAALQTAYVSARALILPSEIEGFGLPALEAYYLGTPVCFVQNTAVEEVLGVATHKGGFSLDSIDSLLAALDEVMQMSAEEVRECGLKLRETYAASKVAEKMVAVFRRVAAGSVGALVTTRGGR